VRGAGKSENQDISLIEGKTYLCKKDEDERWTREEITVREGWEELKRTRIRMVAIY
jgi:hypothetical protein